MGIHNSSGPPIEQRVGNPITEKNTKKISMKAFTTACALIAGVSAESLSIRLPFAGSFSPVYSHGVAHHPLTYSRPVYGPVYTGVHHPIVHHPIFKREADAEPRFTYQTKVTHPDEKSGYEYRVNVDPMGNGHSSASSYQFHEQQRDNMMRQQQRQNQMGNQMFGHVDQFNGQQMQYGNDNRMGGRMDMHNQMVRQRNNQMMAGRDNQMVNEHGYDMFDQMIEQRQDSNMRDQYLRRQDGRMNNFYSYERMLQRQNEARRNMNNQHRMFKREAEPSFEYDVTAEHENNNHQMVSRNQQMMDVMTQPQQQIYHRNDQMNQFNNQRRNQYINQIDQHNRNNMDNRMDQMDSR